MNISRITDWLYRWGPPIALMALIYGFSGLPQRPKTPGVEFGRLDDKVQHFIAYAVLGALMWRAITDNFARKKRMLIAVVLTVAYALFDEIHQYFVPGRKCSIEDIITDTLGAITAVVLLTILTGGGKYDK